MYLKGLYRLITSQNNPLTNPIVGVRCEYNQTSIRSIPNGRLTQRIGRGLILILNLYIYEKIDLRFYSSEFTPNPFLQHFFDHIGLYSY